MDRHSVSRRSFLKLAGASLGGLALGAWSRPAAQDLFPSAERLGRVTTGKVELKLRPDSDSETVGALFEDAVVVWLRELVGRRPMWYSQRWVETPDGFIYAANLQPVRNQPQAPLSALPNPNGIWMEVSVPYVDLLLHNPPARSPWIKAIQIPPRLYYSQILWVDEIKEDDAGQVWYRVNERYGSYGDIFWVPGESMRLIEEAELEPISPEVEEKRVEVNVTRQSMSCFEGNTEVFFTRVSTGGKFDAQGNPSEKWSTPVGPHHIWRKLVSVHMSGGATGVGWDLPGIGWTSLFAGNGVAIHSTFWHNSYGVPTSHGCVNSRPDDAKWVFRWTNPVVSYEPGDLTISGTSSTRVIVVE